MCVSACAQRRITFYKPSGRKVTFPQLVELSLKRKRQTDHRRREAKIRTLQFEARQSDRQECS